MKTLLIPIIAVFAASCAQKAEIVEAPQETIKTKPQESPAITQTKPKSKNTGLRINEDDILALPTTDQLRSHKNTTARTDSPIIVRPPSE